MKKIQIVENNQEKMLRRTPSDKFLENPIQVAQEFDVLVVEDNVVNQMIMKKQLEKLKVKFLITGSGEEGVKLWSREWEPP